MSTTTEAGHYHLTKVYCIYQNIKHLRFSVLTKYLILLLQQLFYKFNNRFQVLIQGKFSGKLIE